jgi:hypothetical protein
MRRRAVPIRPNRPEPSSHTAGGSGTAGGGVLVPTGVPAPIVKLEAPAPAVPVVTLPPATLIEPVAAEEADMSSVTLVQTRAEPVQEVSSAVAEVTVNVPPAKVPPKESELPTTAVAITLPPIATSTVVVRLYGNAPALSREPVPVPAVVTVASVFGIVPVMVTAKPVATTVACAAPAAASNGRAADAARSTFEVIN